MSTWAIIPIRSGSVGLPNKNIMELQGRPLVAWAIDAAKQVKSIDHVIVDTDSPSYAEVAKYYGAITTIRPSHLAADVPTEDVLRDTLLRLATEYLAPDNIACIQCTTPLTRPEDIQACIHAVEKHDFDSAMTVAKITERPEWMFRRKPDGEMTLAIADFASSPELLRGEWGVRQTFPELYRPTGGCYVMTRKTLLEDRRIIGERCAGIETSRLRSLDIDTEEDFRLIEAVLRSGLLLVYPK